MFEMGLDRRFLKSTGLGCVLLGLLGAAAVGQDGRAFLSRDSEQADQPTTGSTTLSMTSSETATVMGFFEDLSAGGHQMNSYQLILPTVAFPMAGATGSIDYVDNNPGVGGGDSIVIDTTRSDWIFADELAVLDPTYNETPTEFFFGVFYATIPGFGPDLAGAGIRYSIQMDYTASADACGDFEIRYRLAPKNPPLTAFFDLVGQSYLPDIEYQTLVVTVDGPGCAGGCQDPCTDDDVCTIDDACKGDECVGQAVDCSGDGDECNAASCDPAGAEGNCATLTPVEDGAPCGDAGQCMAGVCEEGECAKDGDCDDDEECTTDICADDTCSNDPVENGIACNGGAACQDGVCIDQGECQNDDDCDDGEECTADTCADNTCSNDPVADGTECDGGAGVCDAGECVAAGECQNDGDCDDANECTTDSCDANVCINDPIEDGTECGGTGTCQGGVCGGVNDRRIFLAVDGEQGAQPPFGSTSATMEQGTTIRVMAWLEDVTAGGEVVEGYQLMLPTEAIAQDGAVGTVTYVDDGLTGGNSIFLDTLREDWLFFESLVATPPTYNETPDEGFFGIFYAAVQTLGIDPAGTGIRYMVEFDIEASADAVGDFLIRYRLAPKTPPLTALFLPFGLEFVIDEFQELIVTVEGEVKKPTCPSGAIVFVDPVDGTVDARQPHPVDDPDDLQGIDTIVVDGPAGADAGCWSLCENGDSDPSNGIETVGEVGGTYTIILLQPITAGQLTTLLYTDNDSNVTTGSFVSHPGNVNADDVTTPRDILALVDIINDVTQPTYAGYSDDIDHSGEVDATDVMALVDLLNGAGTQDVWLNYVVPAGPCDP